MPPFLTKADIQIYKNFMEIVILENIYWATMMVINSKKLCEAFDVAPHLFLVSGVHSHAYQSVCFMAISQYLFIF